MNILVLNGPNLNLLGTREPEVYGTDTLKDVEGRLQSIAKENNIHISFYQSNSETDLIDQLHKAAENNINLSTSLLSIRDVASFPPPSTKILVRPNLESFLIKSIRSK